MNVFDYQVVTDKGGGEMYKEGLCTYMFYSFYQMRVNDNECF
jgi:hypothetical protein